jgi:hypothetical protein
MPKTGIGVDPVMDRRVKVVQRLEEQKKLLADDTFKRTIRKRGDKVDGKTVWNEECQKVQKWWALQQNGTYAFAIKAGYKNLEFMKGQTAIVVPDLEQLPGVIDILIAACNAGEFDARNFVDIPDVDAMLG